MERPTLLPAGVKLMSLTTHSDARGDLTEILRNEWHGSPPPARWIAVRAAPNTLRGVHVRRRGWRYACVVAGEMWAGLHDLRAERPAAWSVLFRLTGARLQALVIPPGVAHGFYATEGATLVLGASAGDDSDEGACRWDAPELGLDWPCAAPQLSAGDCDAGSYARLRSAFGAAGPVSA